MVFQTEMVELDETVLVEIRRRGFVFVIVLRLVWFGTKDGLGSTVAVRLGIGCCRSSSCWSR